MTFPGTKPARRVHVPPAPSGTLPDPGGRTPAERAYRIQQQTAQAYTNWRNSFPAGIDPDELKDAAGQFAYTDQALSLPDALTPVKDAADAAAQKVNDLVSGNRVASDMAAQVAAQRFWYRAQRRLDSVKEPGKVAAAARDLIASADDDQIRTLSEELGDYLQTRDVPTNWLPDALASRIPGLSDAQDDAITTARQHAMLLANDQKLRRAMASDTDVPPLLDPASVTAQAYREDY